MTIRRLRMTMPIPPMPRLFHPSRLLLSFVAFLLLAGPVAGQEPTTWQGTYHSVSRDQDIRVVLTLPTAAEPGELEFVTLSCSVGLKPAPRDPNGDAVFVLQRQEDAAGPYCGIWLGGQLEIRALDDPQRLETTVTSMSGSSRIDVTLHP